MIIKNIIKRAYNMLQNIPKSMFLHAKIKYTEYLHFQAFFTNRMRFVRNQANLAKFPENNEDNIHKYTVNTHLESYRNSVPRVILVLNYE
jgi:hypothetical protein